MDTKNKNSQNQQSQDQTPSEGQKGGQSQNVPMDDNTESREEQEVEKELD